MLSIQHLAIVQLHSVLSFHYAWLVFLAGESTTLATIAMPVLVLAATEVGAELRKSGIFTRVLITSKTHQKIQAKTS